jgi:hypothetical protein
VRCGERAARKALRECSSEVHAALRDELEEVYRDVLKKRIKI